MIKNILRVIITVLFSFLSNNGRVRLATEVIVLCHSFGRRNAPCKRFLNIFGEYEGRPFTFVYIDRRTLLQCLWRAQETPFIPRVLRFDYQMNFFLFHYRRVRSNFPRVNIDSKSVFKAFFSPEVLDASMVLFFFDRLLEVPRLISVVTPVERLEWEEVLNSWLVSNQVNHIGVAYSDYNNGQIFWQRDLMFDTVLVGSKSAKILASEHLKFKKIRLIRRASTKRVRLEPVKSVIFALQTNLEEILEFASLFDRHFIEDTLNPLEIIISVHPAIRYRDFITVKQRLTHLCSIRVEVGVSEISLQKSQILFFTQSTAWSKCYGSNCVPIQLLKDGITPYPKVSVLKLCKLGNLVEQNFRLDYLASQFAEYSKNYRDLFWI